MSSLDYSDFSTPFTHKTYSKLIGKLNRHENAQLAAASLGGAVVWVASFAGLVGDCYITLDVLPAAGESMVYDLKKNGATILTGTKTVDDSTVDKLVNFRSLLDPAKNSFVSGDILTVDRTYVAGGGPAMVTNVVCVEPSTSPYFY